MAALNGAARGDERLTTVKIYTNPPGIMFRVDGQLFRDSAAVTWPAGSKHTLTAETMQENLHLDTHYSFVAWSTSGEVNIGNGPTVVVTADPAQTYFRADFATAYAVNLHFYRCGDTQAECASPGVVYTGEGAYTQDAKIWVGAGSKLQFQAVPGPGFVFVGWLTATGATVRGSLNDITVTEPMSVTAQFQLARTVHLESSPPGLQLLIDRAPVTTPLDLEWGWGTVHTVAPLRAQDDKYGRTWAFQSWSDGGAATHAYTVQPSSEPAVLTATFVPGVRASFVTSPPGLKLRVDGRDNWYGGYNFTWATGETHHAEAAAEQTDAQGRRYALKGWSNGGAAAQDITITDADAANGVRLTAQYELMGRLALDASVGDAGFVVDGTPCGIPCILDRRPGTEVRVAAPASVPAGDGSRQAFLGWSDGAGAERAFTFTSDIVRLTAAYRLENRLVTAADPTEGARWHYDPQSSDGYYDAQSQVSVRVESRPGFKFRRLEGDLAGAFTSGQLAMTAPRYVRAVLDRVPYIDPAGVRNAAAETPAGTVAPGSMMAIVGVNLASDTASGPASPLAQTLAGVTVWMGDRLLPLFSVAPEQITAFLPSDVEPGPKTLVVRRTGQPEVRADFLVARNAPGLFQTSTDNGNFAVAFHADGSAVSTDSPARRGEAVTLYGTGLGPCDRTPPDGFAVPVNPVYSLADPAEVVSGDVLLQPVWAGALAGRVGVQAVRLNIGTELPSGSAKLIVRVNGQESNAVLLPVE